MKDVILLLQILAIVAIWEGLKWFFYKMINKF